MRLGDDQDPDGVPEVSITIRRAIAEAARPQARLAAIELLVAQGTWLERPDFNRFVSFAPSSSSRISEASIDWQGALDAHLPASPSDRQLLRFAAELARVGEGAPLRDLLVALDDRNAALFLRVVVLGMEER